MGWRRDGSGDCHLPASRVVPGRCRVGGGPVIFWVLGSGLVGLMAGFFIGYRIGLWSMLLLLADQGAEFAPGLVDRFEGQRDAARKGLN